jgi:SdrD B-like protein
MTRITNSLPYLAALAGSLLLTSTASADTIDFEGLAAGTILTSVSSSGGAGPILVSGFNPSFGAGVEAAVVFDSSNPSGGDDDLGSPHADFGGPGAGSGGATGATHANSTALGKILIIAEDLTLDGGGLVADPDDATLTGMTIDFDFSALGTVTMSSCTYIDIETSRPDANVQMFDAGGNSLGIVSLTSVGNNGVRTVSLGSVSGVDHVRVTLNGSGAIGGFDFEVDCTASIGDFVWNDLDGDGIQDVDEPGVEGIRVVLLDGQGGFLADTTTGPDGAYSFTGLCAGDYMVDLDAQDVPDGFQFSPCMAGNDPAGDSNCRPSALTLAPGQLDDTVDFGLTPIPFVSCESLPNSTGQTAGVSGSGSTSIGTNQYSVTFDNLPAGQPAYMFYGTSGDATPFGAGIRCIGTPLVRYRKVPDIGPDGSATIPLVFDAPPMNTGFGGVLPGVPYYFQLWYRDPANVPGFNTSDTLCVTFAP